jgi:hypothetical protein
MSPAPILYEETQGFAPWVYALLVVVLAILAGVLTIRMRTTVSGDSVTVRYGLLGTLVVPLQDIAKAEALEYRPVRDYGGWGWRGFGRRRAVTARGNRGVLMTRRDGSTVLVGSPAPRKFLEALAMAGVATEDKLPADVRSF